MEHTCPACGHRFAEPPELDPVQELAGRFAEDCARSGFVITDNRVSEVVAAKLLGLRKKALAYNRRTGAGPTYFNLPVDGSRYSYDIKALAEWKQFHKVGDDWD